MRKLRDAVERALEDMLLDRPGPGDDDCVRAFREGRLSLAEGPIVCLDIDEQLRLFQPGDLVDPLEPERTLHLEPEPNSRAYLMNDAQIAAKQRLQRARVARWLVINVRWDEPSSYLWIELLSLGGHFRGWIRDPVRWVRIAQLDERP